MSIFCSFQLSFQANSSYGYVALKNFRLSSTPCMLSSDCTFEQGPCGWSDASNNYGFTLTQADATNSALKRDHTLNTGSGHVMYLPPGNDSILTAYISNNVYGKQVQLVPRAYFKVLNTVENSIVCVWNSGCTRLGREQSSSCLLTKIKQVKHKFGKTIKHWNWNNGFVFRKPFILQQVSCPLKLWTKVSRCVKRSK